MEEVKGLYLGTYISTGCPIYLKEFEKPKGNCYVLGQAGEGKAFRLDADNVIKKAWQRYKPNNWLKLHGIPMRRKPLKKQRAYSATDEFHSMFEEDTDKFEVLKIPETGIDQSFVKKVSDIWDSIHK